jgi:hypothetical protein
MFRIADFSARESHPQSGSEGNLLGILDTCALRPVAADKYSHPNGHPVDACQFAWQSPTR